MHRVEIRPDQWDQWDRAIDQVVNHLRDHRDRAMICARGLSNESRRATRLDRPHWQMMHQAARDEVAYARDFNWWGLAIRMALQMIKDDPDQVPDELARHMVALYMAGQMLSGLDWAAYPDADDHPEYAVAALMGADDLLDQWCADEIIRRAPIVYRELRTMGPVGRLVYESRRGVGIDKMAAYVKNVAQAIGDSNDKLAYGS